MKKLVLKTICLIMVMSLILSACGGKKENTSTTTPTTTETSQPTTTQQQEQTQEETSTGPKNPMPIATDGSLTISYACGDNRYAPASLAQNLPVWQEIEKITGVKIQWDVVPNSQYSTSMQTRLASGVNLPDIIYMPVDPYKYGKDGIIIRLNELIEKYGENAAKIYEEKPMVLALMKTPEGDIYHLSGARDEEIAAGPYGWLIRKDWLDKLGLEEPKTVEDWYNVLKAFKEKDPNSNKQADEIPMTNANGVRQLFNWGNAWGLHVKNNDGFYPDENGKIQCEWFDPRAKEMVEFLNKLVKDGLLDLEFATNNQDQMVSKVIRNIAGAVIDWQEFIPMWNNKLKEAEVSDANWVMTALPQGPNGYHGHIETSGIGYGAVSITKDCKNPEAAFRWLDYVMYNPENCRRLHLGVEGISYVVENGQIKMTDFVLNNPDGLGPVEAIRSLGAWTSMPNVNRAEYIKLFKITDQEMLERTKLVEPYIIPRAEFGMPTDEEFERINRKLTDIATYRDEMVTKFILGQEPLDKWDAFLNEMKAMGIDEVLEVRQAQYDRLMTN